MTFQWKRAQLEISPTRMSSALFWTHSPTHVPPWKKYFGHAAWSKAAKTLRTHTGMPKASCSWRHYMGKLDIHIQFVAMCRRHEFPNCTWKSNALRSERKIGQKAALQESNRRRRVRPRSQSRVAGHIRTAWLFGTRTFRRTNSAHHCNVFLATNTTKLPVFFAICTCRGHLCTMCIPCPKTLLPKSPNGCMVA